MTQTTMASETENSVCTEASFLASAQPDQIKQPSEQNRVAFYY